ncbi:MAG: hypothetical protein HYW45_02135 [Candidatus Daviesbacteria bacterium]|nr:MAG: hypothetical protein HYW45_02135 [Candidatus Daviesbacteria bacterium]
MMVVMAKGIKSQVKVSTPPPIPDLEKPILEVSITNPFKKIMYWLDQIRRKQTTTFAIRLSIPLIAIPIIALAFFQLGKSFSLPYSSSALPSPVPTSSPTPDLNLSKAGILKIARGKENRYLLNLKDGRIIVLEIPLGVDLTKYQNKQVLVTGPYNRNTSVMQVEDIAEVELLNETSVTPLPSPSLLPSPTATSSSGSS